MLPAEVLVQVPLLAEPKIAPIVPAQKRLLLPVDGAYVLAHRPVVRETLRALRAPERLLLQVHGRHVLVQVVATLERARAHSARVPAQSGRRHLAGVWTLRDWQR